jgi:hypothetical protein
MSTVGVQTEQQGAARPIRWSPARESRVEVMSGKLTVMGPSGSDE